MTSVLQLTTLLALDLDAFFVRRRPARLAMFLGCPLRRHNRRCRCFVARSTRCRWYRRTAIIQSRDRLLPFLGASQQLSLIKMRGSEKDQFPTPPPTRRNSLVLVREAYESQRWADGSGGDGVFGFSEHDADERSCFGFLQVVFGGDVGDDFFDDDV